MSYISGDQFSFIPRLHQLPTGLADLDLFYIEAQQYLLSGAFPQTGYYRKEFIKKHEIFSSGSGAYIF